MKKRPTLNRRLNSLLLRMVAVFVPALLVVMAVADSRFRGDAIATRLLLARAVAHYVDAENSSTLRHLGQLASHLPTLDDAAVPALRAFRFQSDFREAIYVLDEAGRKIIADPASAEPLPRELLLERETITPLFRKPGAATLMLAAVQPFQRNRHTFYLVSEMNPVGSPLSTLLQELGTTPDLRLFVVDAQGKVIAAPDQRQLFQTAGTAALLGDRIHARRAEVFETAHCSLCDQSPEPGGFLNVVVPLRFAPWGVLLQQQTRRAFAAVYTARAAMACGGLILAVLGIALARALSRSLVVPIQSLSAQAELLDAGQLDRPIAVEGDREIEVLASTLDAGRRRLAATLDDLRTLNDNLELEVAARTRTLQEQYENLRLRNEVFRLSTQETSAAQYLPEVLRLLAEHYGFAAIAVRTEALDEPHPVCCLHPPDAALPWFDVGATPPDDWEVRRLEYRDTLYARLFHPRLPTADDELMAVLCGRLALSLHGAALLRRTLVQDQQRRGLVRRLLTAGEEERKRIARELHDEISQLLTVIQLSLEEAGIDHPGFRKARELLSRTQKEVHRIIHDLRPSLLDDLGLAAAIRSHATNLLSKKGIETSVGVEDDLDLPPEVEISAFRIYQEIITNILRHSGAESVSLELYVDNGELVLDAEDDGIGFDPDQRSDGAGILGMRERAALVGGSITVTSEPGLGTHVIVRIPLQP